MDLADDEVLLPGLVDTHVHVNEPGRTEWEGFATATRAAAAGGVTTILDMPLNSIPATTTVAALEIKRLVATGQVFVDVGFWGGAVPGNVPDLASMDDARVFGFKCFLLDSGVAEFGHLEPEAFALAMQETAKLGALMIVHAEDGHLLDDSALDGDPLRRLPRLAAARRGGGRDRPGHRAGEGLGRPDARRPPQRRRRRAGPARRPRGRCRPERRDLPALPDLRRRAHRRRRHRAQVLPADPRGGQPGGALGGAGRGRRRLRRVRPLAVHGRPQAGRRRRLRCGLGRDRVGAARPAGGVDRRPRPRALARRRGPLDGHRDRRPGGARPQGPDRGRRRRRPGAVRAGRGVHRRRGAAAPPQPGLGLRRAPAGRRGARDLAARRTRVSRDLEESPRGRLLQRGVR